MKVVSSSFVQPKLRILVVDDQHPVLLTYMLVLQQQGYAVTGALTYAAALEHLQKDRYDLLLCDFGLDDGRSGLEVIERARARHPRIVPVLLTGYANPEILQQARQLGVSLLYKPIEVCDLLQSLKSAVRARGAA